jgi:hypothetical protein
VSRCRRRFGIDFERPLARRARFLVPARVEVDDLLSGLERPELRIARAEANRRVELAEALVGPARDAEELSEE